MSNQKRNVHKSGPIGMLMDSGEITTVDFDSQSDSDADFSIEQNGKDNLNQLTYKTKTGIIFSGNELIQVDPTECEPWRYANRQEEEIGDIAELVDSIRQNGQLQPALIRDHRNPTHIIKYEIIFGRRRQIACKNLGISLLAIKKNLNDNQDAIASQDAENRYRNNVSNFSNAILYKKLLSDGIFKEEKDIAIKLGITKSSFSELMSFNKIPEEVVHLIPKIHDLSVSMALKINSLLKEDHNHVYQMLLKVSPQIGITITSPDKLEKAILGQRQKERATHAQETSFTNQNGIQLFSVKESRNGDTCILINRSLKDKIKQAELYEYIRKYLDERTI